MNARASSGPPPDPEARTIRFSSGDRWNIWTWGTPSPRTPTVIALHGFTGCGHDWEWPVARFGQEFACWMAPDLPGHGGTVDLSGDARYSLDAIADNLAEWIAALPDKPVLIGYSMGGRAALSFAARYAPNVAALILIGASPGIDDPQERARRLQADATLADRLEHTSMEDFAAYWESLPLLRSQSRIPSPWRERLRMRRRERNPVELARSLRAAGAGTMIPNEASLRSITVPALYLAGDADEKFVSIGRRLVSRLPAGTFLKVPAAGHAPHLEHVGFFLRELKNFLGRNLGGPNKEK